MEMPGIRLSGYIVSALRFVFVDQLISNLHTSIILRISSLSSKLGKIRKKKSCLYYELFHIKMDFDQTVQRLKKKSVCLFFQPPENAWFKIYDK